MAKTRGGGKVHRRTLCVFPNDTLQSSFKKGEIKERYFNPENIFDEIHVISLAGDDLDPGQVQKMFGIASVRVHCIGPKSSLGRQLWKMFPELYYLLRFNEVMRQVAEIRPSVIRAYNPMLQGFLAVYASTRLSIPSIVSVHGNYDKDERMLIPRRLAFWLRKNPAKTCYDYFQLFKYQTVGKLFERLSLGKADEVICAYQFPVEYVQRFRKVSPHVVYNRVDTDLFAKSSPRETAEPIIIHVSRLTCEKNPENLIRSTAKLPVKLILIGDGELRTYLRDLTEKLDLTGKVEFIPSVQHSLMPQMYRQSDIFVMCMSLGGVSIPMLEAMASGKPMIYTRGVFEKKKELVGGIGICVNDNPAEIAEAVRSLVGNLPLQQNMGELGRLCAERISGEKMEELEAEIYMTLIMSMTQKTNQSV